MIDEIAKGNNIKFAQEHDINYEEKDLTDLKLEKLYPGVLSLCRTRFSSAQ